MVAEQWLKKSRAVATLDDTAIGLAGLFPCGGNQSHSAWLILFVHDEFQGRSVGTLMMTALIATAHMLDLRRLQLTVFCDNERAISLYRKCGFAIEGRHECYARRGDEFAAAFTMARIANKATAVWPPGASGRDFLVSDQVIGGDSDPDATELLGAPTSKR